MFYSLRKEREKIRKLAGEYNTIIFLLVNYNSFEILNTLKDLGKKIIVISSLTPVYLKETPWVETSIALYGTGEDSFKAGFAVLAGDYEAEGILPIDLD